LALNLQVAEASVAAMHDMPIVVAAKAIASRQAITFPFDVCIGLAGPPLSCCGLDERRRGEPFDEAPSSLVRCAARRLARKQTVYQRDERAPFHCSVPPPLRNKRNSIGDCHACSAANCALFDHLVGAQFEIASCCLV
jgi:hypothetical protein